LSNSRPRIKALEILIKRPAVYLRPQHAKPPQGDHLAHQPRLRDACYRHPQNVALLRLSERPNDVPHDHVVIGNNNRLKSFVRNLTVSGPDVV
jgi:hypothetical protein